MNIFKKSKFKESGKHGVTVRRLLSVEVVEARGLKALNKAKLGKIQPSSDPFAVISLKDIGGREIKNETFKVKQVNATLSPVWKESFVFGQQYVLKNSESLPSLQVVIYHKGQFDFSETSLGKVEIPLTNVGCDVVDSWYPIKADGRTVDVSGEVCFFLVTF